MDTFIGTIHSPFSDARPSLQEMQPTNTGLGPGPSNSVPPVEMQIESPRVPDCNSSNCPGRSTSGGGPLTPPIVAFGLQSQPRSTNVQRVQSAQLIPLDSSQRGQALTARSQRSQFVPGETIDIVLFPCSLEEGKRIFNRSFSMPNEQKAAFFAALKGNWTLPAIRADGSDKIKFIKASPQHALNGSSTLTSMKPKFTKLRGIFTPNQAVVPVVPIDAAIFSAITVFVTETFPHHELLHRCYATRFFAQLARSSPSHTDDTADPAVLCTTCSCLSNVPSIPADWIPSPDSESSSQAAVHPFVPGPSVPSPALSMSALPEADPPVVAPQARNEATVTSRTGRIISIFPAPVPRSGHSITTTGTAGAGIPATVIGVSRARSLSMEDLSAAPPSRRQRQHEPGVPSQNTDLTRDLTRPGASTSHPIIVDIPSIWKDELALPGVPNLRMTLDFQNAFVHASTVAWRKDGEDQLHVNSSTRQSSARAVVTHIAHFIRRRDGRAAGLGGYREPRGTTMWTARLSSYLHPFSRDITIGPSVGRGPEVATYLEILRSLVDVHDNTQFEYARHVAQPMAMPWGLWEERNGYVVPVLDDVASDTLEDDRFGILSAQGMVAALVMGRFALAPRPIHPVLILWALLGDSAFKMSFELLLRLDPIAANELRPWYALNFDEHLPSHEGYHSEPVWALLMGRLGVQPQRIGFTPDASSRIRYTRQLVCATVLGKTTANAPELEAFRNGFTVQFGAADVERFCDLFAKPVSVTGGSRTASLDPFVVVQTLYSRTIKSPQDVARLMTYAPSMLESLASTPAERKIQELYEDMFECRLLRWLYGQGHPDHSMLRDAPVPLLRAKSYLLIPIGGLISSFVMRTTAEMMQFWIFTPVSDTVL
ncbi:uncharacterized protein C8Q71DRAFT_881117 [Rhodofomes roseus]|uniref:HECT domain-containing protein n=1 Tax=Rhodofomes roseus TaxID=34475 RepID=A0ABQ8K4H6_9APHY|nr:uncharacterized protein C8Q71DRAFT_881117 [Rhodofomes roseus]KAH9831804.1 hypothetical protein C8Q71DRAFT_881117 [Rhodofomes roseus]